jgi:hypothetical protein
LKRHPKHASSKLNAQGLKSAAFHFIHRALSVRFFTFPLMGLLATVLGLLPLSHAQAADRYCPSFLEVQGAPEPAHRGEFTISPYTIHWSNNPEHKPVFLVALDEQVPGNRFCGLALFSNSFGQPSAFVYVGQQYNDWLSIPKLFVKVTAGLMYGYVSPYENKVPLNYKGFNPAIIPSIGYKLTAHDSVQVKVLGSAGLMFSYGRQF